MGITRTQIIEYLINYAGFTQQFVKEKSTDHLFGIYMDKINTASKYLEDVQNYYKQHPEITDRPTNSALKQMGYLEIRDLRKELGIPEILKKEKKYKTQLGQVISFFREHPEIINRPSEEEIFNLSMIELEKLRKKYKITANTQKVIDIEPALETARKAREVIDKMNTTQLAAGIMIKAHQDDYQFIYPEEAIAMYGDDVTEEYLESLGYKLYEPLNNQNENQHKKRM